MPEVSVASPPAVEESQAPRRQKGLVDVKLFIDDPQKQEYYQVLLEAGYKPQHAIQGLQGPTFLQKFFESPDLLSTPAVPTHTPKVKLGKSLVLSRKRKLGDLSTLQARALNFFEQACGPLDLSSVAVDNADQAVVYMKSVERFLVKQQSRLEEQIKIAAESTSSQSAVSAKDQEITVVIARLQQLQEDVQKQQEAVH